MKAKPSRRRSSAILADLPKDSANLKGPIANHAETYYPALALILLCEYDDQKYESEIKILIEILMRRQTGDRRVHLHGRQEAVGDTSQMQYAALAMFVADQHQFRIDPKAAKAALNWLTGTQQRQNGSFIYKIRDPTATAIHVEHALSGIRILQSNQPESERFTF